MIRQDKHPQTSGEARKTNGSIARLAANINGIQIILRTLLSLYCSGRGTRTPDLKVMSLASHHCSIPHCCLLETVGFELTFPPFLTGLCYRCTTFQDFGRATEAKPTALSGERDSNHASRIWNIEQKIAVRFFRKNHCAFRVLPLNYLRIFGFVLSSLQGFLCARSSRLVDAFCRNHKNTTPFHVGEEGFEPPAFLCDGFTVRSHSTIVAAPPTAPTTCWRFLSRHSQ